MQLCEILHETHPGEFGMKFLANYICWPHICGQIHYHGINCTHCTRTGKSTETLIPNNSVGKLLEFSHINEEII